MGHSNVLIKVGLSFAQVAKQQTASSALCTEGLIRASFVNKRRRGKNSPIQHNKREHQSSYRRESVRVLDTTRGCQRDGLDVTGEHLHGCKAGKQIKRDELALGGLVLDLWGQLRVSAKQRVHKSVKAVKRKFTFTHLSSSDDRLRLTVELFDYGGVHVKKIWGT